MKNVMFASLQNVRPSHLLDKELWRRLGLAAATGVDGAPPGTGLVDATRLVRTG